MSGSSIWGSMSKLTGNFMSKFGNGVSQGMTAAVATVTDTARTINEELFNDGEEHYFEEDRSEQEVREILNSGSGRNHEDEKITVMKWLVAQMSKGVNVSNFFPDVVKLVICPSVELKRYVYLYLTQYCDYDENCRENALLSVNTFQQDMSGKNPRIRALALRVMTSIRVLDIWPLQLMAVQKCSVDSVPFVRKIACHSLLKLYQYDPTQVESIVDILKRLLRERNSLVFSSAIIAYNEICPERYDLLNYCFHTMLDMLPLMEDSAQVVALTVLMKYARTQFTEPSASALRSADDVAEVPVAIHVAPKKKSAAAAKKAKLDSFYGEESESYSESYSESEEEKKEEPAAEPAAEPAESPVEEKVDPDFIKLIHVADELLMSINSAVVLAAASLLLHLCPGDSSYVSKSIHTLVLLIQRDSCSAYFLLSAMDELSALYPQYFAPYIKSFFVRVSDPSYIVPLKTHILCRLITEETVDDVIASLSPFAVHPSSVVVQALIDTMLVIAERLPSSSRLCLRVFIQLVDLRGDNDVILHSAVMGIDRLLHVVEGKEQQEVLLWCMKNILERQGQDASDGLLFLLLHHGAVVLPQAEEVCRRVLLRYKDTAKSTRLVLLQLLVKIKGLDPENEKVQKMLQYVLELNSKDMDVDIRVQARNVRALLFSDNKYVEQVLPAVLNSDNRANELLTECHLGDYYLGSLSLVLHEECNGFVALPDWTEVGVSAENRDAEAIERKEKAEEERKEREKRKAEKMERKEKKPAKKEEYSYSDYSYSEDEKEEKKEKKEKKAEKEEYSDYSYSDYSYSEDEKKEEKKEEDSDSVHKEVDTKLDAPKEKKAEKEEYSDYSYSDYSYSDDEKK